MNTDLLLLSLALALALGGVMLWRGRRRRPAAPASTHSTHSAHSTRPAALADSTPAAPSAMEAQRLAATEALRQARLRKAAQADRLLRQQAELKAEFQAAPAAPSLPIAPAGRGRVMPPQAAPAAVAPSAREAATPVAPSSAAAPSIERIRKIAAFSPPTAVPAAAAAPAPAPAPAPAAAPVAAPSAAPSARFTAEPSAPPTVLLVDDSKLVRVKTGRLLQQRGWQVLLAEDGLAAWQQLQARTIDLLITDVEMPGLDGFELTRRLRADRRWRDLPVIMISGSDDRLQATARAAGVNLLLGKPYADAHLLAQAQRLIGRRVLPAESSLAVH